MPPTSPTTVTSEDSTSSSLPSFEKNEIHDQQKSEVVNPNDSNIKSLQVPRETPNPQSKEEELTQKVSKISVHLRNSLSQV